MPASPPRLASPLFKASLLSIALLMSDVGAVSPVLPDIAERFPEQSQAAIQGFISFPAIAALAATLVAGMLSNKVGKRRLVLLGILLIVIGGLSPLVLIPVGSYPLVITFRLIAGFGMGLLQPLASSLIADFYQGSERSKLLGWQSSMVGLGSILWSLVVTVLVLMGWMAAFFVYVLALVIFALVFRNVPEPTAAADTAAAQGSAGAAPAGRRLPKGIAVAVLAMFLMTLGFQAMTISTPFLASERDLAATAQVGLVMTTFGVASVVAGVVFGLTYRALRAWTGLVALLVLAAGLASGYVAHSLAMLFVTAILVGLGFGTYMPFAITAINARATVHSSALSTALMFSGAAVAGFVAPYFYTAIGASTAGAQFGASFVLILVTAVIGGVYHQAEARWVRAEAADAALDGKVLAA